MFENIQVQTDSMQADFNKFGALMSKIEELQAEATALRGKIITSLEEANQSELSCEYGTLRQKSVSVASIDTKAFIKAFGVKSHDAIKVEVTKARNLFGKELIERKLIQNSESKRWEYRKA
jgi:hypothetical protein